LNNFDAQISSSKSAPFNTDCCLFFRFNLSVKAMLRDGYKLVGFVNITGETLLRKGIFQRILLKQM
jgi:hypothetical protein